MNENKHIISQIVQAIIFFAKQGISFRGDVECVLQSNKRNPGNFLALLKTMLQQMKSYLTTLILQRQNM